MKEFEEIAHSGGKVAFSVVQHPDTGGRAIQFSWTSSRPVPVVLVSLWALFPGVAVETLPLRGMGAPWSPPRIPGSIPVLIGSDSEGQFGHLCPECEKYWRSGPFPTFCPYCGTEGEWFQFLSKAQQAYVHFYCQRWAQAETVEIGQAVEIDMDEVADATMNRTTKPAFYISEERQQTKLICSACGEFNDLLGRFGFCSCCRTRNDFQVFAEESIPAIRGRLDDGAPPENCLRDAVSAFDALLNQYALQLASHVPMSPARVDAMTNNTFRSLDDRATAYANWFDIDLRAGISQSDWNAAVRHIFRRHLYEHNGGVVDAKYLARTSDPSVRLGQHISETPQSIHPFLATLVSIAKRLHDGFHTLIATRSEPIKHHQEAQARRKRS